NGTALTLGDLPKVVSAADLTAGKLVFRPGANENTAPHQTLTLNVQDNGRADNGGHDTSAAAATMTVDVNSVNDAPTAVASSVTTNEDTDRAFAGADFSFTDTGDSPANGLAAVIVSSFPTRRSSDLNGTALTLGDLPKVVSAADLTAGKLVFRP